MDTKTKEGPRTGRPTKQKTAVNTESVPGEVRRAPCKSRSPVPVWVVQRTRCKGLDCLCALSMHSAQLAPYGQSALTGQLVLFRLLLSGVEKVSRGSSDSYHRTHTLAYSKYVHTRRASVPLSAMLTKSALTGLLVQFRLLWPVISFFRTTGLCAARSRAGRKRCHLSPLHRACDTLFTPSNLSH